ncbi:MAG: hypothetical protein ABI614_28390, partial [Planctomycetota bacterium]
MSWTSVFDSDFRLPEQVCIVAPGPQGVGHYSEIPDGFSIIAVSKAVLIPELRSSVWIMNHVQQPWYNEADASFRDIRVFGFDAATESMATENEQVKVEGARYYFKPPDEALGLEEFVPVDGCIRVGATTSACAVQLAYNFGAREIVLCGVDMSGDAYYDGTINENPYHGEIWPAAARLNVLIHWLRVNRGLQITTVSPTKLDVPHFRHR